MTSKKKAILLQPIDANQRYGILEAAAYLRVSRARLYANISAGTITTIRDGTRRYVPGSEIIRVSRAPTAPQAA